MFKTCARCGEEYQAWVTQCPDCGVPLDLAPGETLAPEPAAGAATPLEDPVPLRLGEPRELQALAEALQAHGISSQIDVYPLGAAISGGRAGSRGQPARLCLYVGRADHAAAREFVGGAEVVASDPTVCPACGEPTAENAAACGACGLEFPEVDENA